MVESIADEDVMEWEVEVWNVDDWTVEVWEVEERMEDCDGVLELQVPLTSLPEFRV